MVNYTQTLSTFHAEMNRLLMERGKIDEQIENLTSVIEIVQRLAKQSNEPIAEPPPMRPDEETGFTDRVRAVLKSNNPRPLTAVDIRDVLLKSAPKDDPKIMMIHTHNTLKRLEKQEEVEEVPGVDGRNAYRWLDAESYGALPGIMSGEISTVLNASPLSPNHPLHKLKRRPVNEGASNRIGKFLAMNTPVPPKQK